MIALVMAGGKGSRMDSSQEKLVLKYKKPIILHVIDALKNSKCFSKIIAVTSINSPNTKDLLEQSGIETFETKGDNYVEDLNSALRSLNDYVLVVSGDLPLLDEKILKQITENNFKNTWTSIIVTTEFLNSIGIKSKIKTKFNGKECAYTGISLVDANKISNLKNIEEIFLILDDKRIALNVNTKEEYEMLTKM